MSAKSSNLRTSTSSEGEFLHELEEKLEVSYKPVIVPWLTNGFRFVMQWRCTFTLSGRDLSLHFLTFRSLSYLSSSLSLLPFLLFPSLSSFLSSHSFIPSFLSFPIYMVCNFLFRLRVSSFKCTTPCPAWTNPVRQKTSRDLIRTECTTDGCDHGMVDPPITAQRCIDLLSMCNLAPSKPFVAWRP